MFAAGLLRLALASGEVGYAEVARDLVDACLTSGGATDDGGAPEESGTTYGGATSSLRFRAPGGGDPVLTAQGLALPADPSEGAYPSGLSAIAGAARTLHLLTGDRRYVDAASDAMRPVASLALTRPLGFGAALSVMSALAAPVEQLVVVGESGPELAALVRRWDRAGSVATLVSAEQAQRFAASGFDLFSGRTPVDDRAAAYLCRDFVCRLPVTDASVLASLLTSGA